jgi:hypothetical protein
MAVYGPSTTERLFWCCPSTTKWPSTVGADVIAVGLIGRRGDARWARPGSRRLRSAVSEGGRLPALAGVLSPAAAPTGLGRAKPARIALRSGLLSRTAGALAATRAAVRSKASPTIERLGPRGGWGHGDSGRGAATFPGALEAAAPPRPADGEARLTHPTSVGLLRTFGAERTTGVWTPVPARRADELKQLKARATQPARRPNDPSIGPTLRRQRPTVPRAR